MLGWLRKALHLAESEWHLCKIRNGRVVFDPPVRLQWDERIEIRSRRVGARVVWAKYRVVKR